MVGRDQFFLPALSRIDKGARANYFFYSLAPIKSEKRCNRARNSLVRPNDQGHIDWIQHAICVKIELRTLTNIDRSIDVSTARVV